MIFKWMQKPFTLVQVSISPIQILSLTMFAVGFPIMLYLLPIIGLLETNWLLFSYGSTLVCIGLVLFIIDRYRRRSYEF